MLTAQNKDCDSSTCNILLVSHGLVGGQQKVEPSVLCLKKQSTVREPVPTLFESCANVVSFEVGAKWNWRRLVKQDQHSSSVRRFLVEAVRRELDHRLDLIPI